MIFFLKIVDTATTPMSWNGLNIANYVGQYVCLACSPYGLARCLTQHSGQGLDHSIVHIPYNILLEEVQEMGRDGGDGGSDLLLTRAFCSDLKLQLREKEREKKSHGHACSGATAWESR
jgi:hypothetical protein